MTQSQGMSFLEALANVAIGFLIALLIRMAVFPLVGVRLTVERHFVVAGTFTAVSLVRGYLLRRYFERLGRGGG